MENWLAPAADWLEAATRLLAADTNCFEAAADWLEAAVFLIGDATGRSDAQNQLKRID